MKKLIGRIEPVVHLQGRLNTIAGGVYAPEDETNVTYIVKDKTGKEVPSDFVEEESTAATKIIQLLVAIGGSTTDEELAEIEAEVDRLLNETDPVELGNLAGHSIVNKIRLAQVYRDDIISAIEEKGISAADEQPFRTVADLVKQIIRQAKTVTPTTEEQIITPDDGVYGLESVTVEGVQLQEINVWSTDAEQIITPDEGYLGFSKVIVDAVDMSGGGGSDGGDYEDWESAEDETFGDDYFNVPTGNYDYSAGADENPSYIPEIPGEGYKALFSKKLKLGNQFHYYIDGVGYDVKFKYNGPGYLYTTYGYQLDDDGSYAKWMHIFLYSETNFDVLEKESTAESWTDHGLSAPSHYSNGWFYDLWQGGASGRPANNAYYTPGHPWSITGMPVFDLGRFSDHDTFLVESRKLATSTESEEMGSDQFIAFVSDTQILYDGSVINNTDKSPMTIYECNASDKNTWSEIGKTDGTDYQVGAYTLVWNSHDLKDMEGLYVTQSKSDEPIAEMSEGDIGIPVERNETYTIEGETVNTFVGAAQRVTGGKTPQTPAEAALALDEYYNHPAESLKW